MHIPDRLLSGIERASFGVGTLLSCFLLHCIMRRTKSDLGAYKYMQVLFVVIDISYAAFQVVLVERFIAQDSIVAVIGLGRYSNNLILITAFLALYSLTFIIIDFNFLYRLWAMNSPSKVKLFSQKRFVVLIALIVVVEYFFWFHIAYTFFSATDHGRLKIRNVTFEKFGVDALTQDMIMGDYFHEDGSRNWHPAVAVITFCNVLAFCFGFMIYASFNIVRCLRDTKVMSATLLGLQRQLFITLSAQTLIPFVLLYSPCGINIVFPFFGWDAEIVADLSPLSLSLFLPFDAIAVLYLMKDYRRAVISFLTWGRFGSSNQNMNEVMVTAKTTSFVVNQ